MEELQQQQQQQHQLQWAKNANTNMALMGGNYIWIACQKISQKTLMLSSPTLRHCYKEIVIIIVIINDLGHIKMARMGLWK